MAIDPKKAVLYEHKQRVNEQPSQNTYKPTPPAEAPTTRQQPNEQTPSGS
jgi:hypothetical protein